jgi:4'-phosphopantetheinyl transferase
MDWMGKVGQAQPAVMNAIAAHGISPPIKRNSMNEGFSQCKLPAAATIEVWSIDLDRPLNPEANLNSILSIEERNRAERYLYSKDASRFRLCRAMLRLGVAWYLETTPQKIALATNRHGKPCIAECPALNFNVSHSGGLGVIAFTTAGEVGIDVEAIRCDVGAVEIASAHFTRIEAASIAAATPQEQASAFLRLWTRKEAVLKAAGCGLLGGLDGLDVSQGPLDQVRLCSAAGDRAESFWRIQDLEQIEGFAGAVAAPTGNWSVVQRPVRYEDAIHGSLGRIFGVE